MRTLSIFLLLALTAQVIQAQVPENRQQEITQALADNDWKQAEKMAKKLIKDHPEQADAHYLLAVATRTKLQHVGKMRAMMSFGSYKKALARTLELNPTHVKALSEQIGFLIFAPGIAGGDREEAAQKIEILEKADPVAGMQMRYQLAAAEDNIELQKSALDQLQAMDPDNPEHDLTRAMFNTDQKDYAAAEKVLLQMLTLEDPYWTANANYQRARWRVLAEQEQQQAVDILQSYVEQYPQLEKQDGLPSPGAAHWRMGLAYEQLGDLQAARQHLQTSVELDPDFEQAQDDLKRLR